MAVQMVVLMAASMVGMKGHQMVEVKAAQKVGNLVDQSEPSLVGK